MDFNEYEKLAARTASFSDEDVISSLTYLALGIAGESGEVVEKIKKVIRNDDAVLSSQKRDEIVRELGDVLWYLSQMSRVLRVPFEEVARINIEKLADRAQRGVIKSEGDFR